MLRMLCSSRSTPSPELKLTNFSLFKVTDVVRLWSSYLSTEDHENMQNSIEFKNMAGHLLEPKMQTRRLLGYVKQADWQSMDEMTKERDYRGHARDMWQLMSNPIEHMLVDGKTEVITPLKYAAKIKDTYSRNQLLTYVPEEKQPLFLQHIQEQKEFIDLGPLFQVYTEFNTLYQRWSENYPRRTDVGYGEVFDRCWARHGQRMREVFNYARHFIKEMCRHGSDVWDKDAKFDSPLPPVDCYVFDLLQYDYVSIAAVAADFGVAFSLTRGTRTSRAGTRCTDRGGDWGWEVLRDLAAFRRLLEVRTEDLVKQISLLDSPSRRAAKRPRIS